MAIEEKKKPVRPSFKAFVGIDISKATLDLCLYQDGTYQSYKTGNSVADLKTLFKDTPELKALKKQKTFYCFERMGIYGDHLCTFLEGKKAFFSAPSPLHIKKSMGLVRGKSDKIDAERQ